MFDATGLTLITWNVMRDGSTTTETLLSMIEKYDPDIICLQEINPAITKPITNYTLVFHNHPWSKKHRNYENDQRQDGTGILISNRLINQIDFCSVIRLPETRLQQRQRYAPLAVFKTFAIASAHLCHNQIKNRQQLAVISNKMPADKPAIIAGDFNMIGPTFEPKNWTRVSPAKQTFRPYPFSLDRVLIRGQARSFSTRLKSSLWETSDHIPVLTRIDEMSLKK